MPIQRNIQHENSMSAINEGPLKRPTTDVAAGANGANICAILWYWYSWDFEIQTTSLIFSWIHLIAIECCFAGLALFVTDKQFMNKNRKWSINLREKNRTKRCILIWIYTFANFLWFENFWGFIRIEDLIASKWNDSIIEFYFIRKMGCRNVLKLYAVLWYYLNSIKNSHFYPKLECGFRYTRMDYM